MANANTNASGSTIAVATVETNRLFQSDPDRAGVEKYAM